MVSVKKTFSLTGILLCLFSFAALSQKSYIVLSNGDTITTTLSMEDIGLSGITVNGTEYKPEQVKRVVTVSGEAYAGIEIEGKDAIFAQYIIEGNISYLYNSEDGKKYHLLEKGGAVYRLQDQKDVVNTPQGPRTRVLKTHRGVLSLLMSDCEEIFPKIERSFLAFNAIADITKEYNKTCSPENEPFRVSNNYLERKPSWGLTVGYQTTSIDFSSGDLVFAAQHLLQTDFNNSSGLLLGGHVDVPLKGIHPNLALHLELLYGTNSFSGYSEFDEIRPDGSGAVFTENIVTFDYDFLSLSVLPRWYFLDSRFSPYGSLGFSLRSLFSVTSERDWLTYPSNGGNPVGERRNAFLYREIQAGLLVEAGVSYKYKQGRGKMLSVGCRLESGSGIDNFNPTLSDTRTISLISAFNF